MTTRSKMDAIRAAADQSMVEREAQEIARNFPLWPLSAEERAQVARTLRGVPPAVLRRARELVKERWDREATESKTVGLARKDLERLKRNSRAALEFTRKVLGRK